MRLRLKTILPTRFAQDCATDGFVASCGHALESLATTETAASATMLLAGLAAGPLALIGIYAGASFLQWKRDARAADAVRDHFRQLAIQIRSVEEGVWDQQELAGLLAELLEQNAEMQGRLDRAEAMHPDDPAKATAAAVAALLRDLDAGAAAHLDQVQANICIYLDDLKWRVEDIKDDTGAIRQAIPTLATKADLAELKAIMLEALDNKSPASPSQPDATPPVDPAAEAAATAVMLTPEASLLDRVNAAVLMRDPAASGLLDQLDRLVEIADYTRHQRRGDFHFFRGEYDAAIAPYEEALALRPADFTARTNAALAHAQARLGNIADHRLRAIELYEETLRLFPRAAHPVEWAMTQNNLGTAWQDLPTGDRAANLGRAIACYESALEVRTRAAHPVAWAMTQNNLGNAWQNLPTGDRAANLGKAIACYELALEVRTRAAHPVEWAMTQNNLGIAWRNLPTGDRAANLGKAIACYERALKVYTRAAHPVDWATTQNNLGNAWQNIPTGDRAANLGKAIACYESALEVRTRSAHPAAWAMTQNNLGAALADLAEQPGQDRCGLLRRAIASGKGALTVRTPEAFPHDHTNTLHNLNIDRRTYEAADCAAEIPFDDIPPAQ